MEGQRDHAHDSAGLVWRQQRRICEWPWKWQVTSTHLTRQFGHAPQHAARRGSPVGNKRATSSTPLSACVRRLLTYALQAGSMPSITAPSVLYTAVREPLHCTPLVCACSSCDRLWLWASRSTAETDVLVCRCESSGHDHARRRYISGFNRPAEVWGQSVRCLQSGRQGAGLQGQRTVSPGAPMTLMSARHIQD